MSRIGQGFFRHLVLEIWNYKCAVTQAGILLCASHIKPWRLSTNRERLDGFNGLALTPHFDQAFDAGFVSFQDDGEILLSRRLPAFDAHALGIRPGLRLGGVESGHIPYLQFHRQMFGFS